MKSTTLIAALSGLAVLSALPTPTLAFAGPESKASKKVHNETLEDLLPDMKKPELWIGSSAPELSIAKFVKGDSVNGFEEGQVYVVEFWATWCGPCIAAFPHLTQLQSDHGEDVQFIGVNIWEREKGQERMEKVEKFVQKQGERMGYTVAIEDGSSMADNWMRPAGQGGIPAAFIVNGDGQIAWIGHPAEIDEPLEAVVSGKFDAKAAAADAWNEQVVMTAFQTFAQALHSGENLENARKISKVLIKDHFNDDSGGLNAVAWILLNGQAEGVGIKDYQTALQAAAMACQMTDWEDWGVIDTYALAMHKTGDNTSAIKWQKKAIELAKLDNKKGGQDAVGELEERLAMYEEN
jgi:thiol-disulfide isomerase/thioredoxin